MKIDLIKASAGSGKTYTLMTLLSQSIASGVRPEGLLATTFTVKAAAELQSRIRQELLSGSNPELASQVFDGLIGTVNGVCGQLLGEYAIESGLSPALDVLPDENADVIFNTSLFYEILVLRPKIEPILREVPDTEPEYGEAKRLLKFLDNFIPIQTEEIPPTSILREFIGGSSFKY